MIGLCRTGPGVVGGRGCKRPAGPDMPCSSPDRRRRDPAHARGLVQADRFAGRVGSPRGPAHLEDIAPGRRGEAAWSGRRTPGGVAS